MVVEDVDSKQGLICWLVLRTRAQDSGQEVGRQVDDVRRRELVVHEQRVAQDEGVGGEVGLLSLEPDDVNRYAVTEDFTVRHVGRAERALPTWSRRRRA